MDSTGTQIVNIVNLAIQPVNAVLVHLRTYALAAVEETQYL